MHAWTWTWTWTWMDAMVPAKTDGERSSIRIRTSRRSLVVAVAREKE